MSKKRYIFSDFDGTLTTKDSMMEIIIYQRGKSGLIIALLSILPWLIMMLLHLYPNQKTKEKLLYHCFGSMTESEFDAFCQRFADAHKHILRDNLYQKLLRAKAEGTEVVVKSKFSSTPVPHGVQTQTTRDLSSCPMAFYNVIPQVGPVARGNLSHCPDRSWAGVPLVSG